MAMKSSDRLIAPSRGTAEQAIAYAERMGAYRLCHVFSLTSPLNSTSVGFTDPEFERDFGQGHDATERSNFRNIGITQLFDNHNGRRRRIIRSVPPTDQLAHIGATDAEFLSNRPGGFRRRQLANGRHVIVGQFSFVDDVVIRRLDFSQMVKANATLHAALVMHMRRTWKRFVGVFVNPSMDQDHLVVDAGSGISIVINRTLPNKTTSVLFDFVSQWRFAMSAIVALQVANGQALYGHSRNARPLPKWRPFAASAQAISAWVRSVSGIVCRHFTGLLTGWWGVVPLAVSAAQGLSVGGIIP